MSEVTTWAVPGPPPPYVVSVRDVDSQEWLRHTRAGTLWQRGGQIESWDWLVFYRGPLTADRLAE